MSAPVNHVSMSGVPMVPRAVSREPTISEAVATLGGMLVAAQDKLAQTLAEALTCRPVAAATVARPKSMSMTFTRGAGGKLDHGTMSNGTATWNLSAARSAKGNVERVTMSNGASTWNLSIARDSAGLSVEAVLA